MNEIITTAVLRVNHYVDIDGRIVKVDLTPIGPAPVKEIARAAYNAALHRHRIDGKPADADVRTIESFATQSIRLRLVALELARYIRAGATVDQLAGLMQLVEDLAADLRPYIESLNRALPRPNVQLRPALPPRSAGR